jgi:hypothetical protein
LVVAVTLCNKCAKAVCQKNNLEQPEPRVCIRCYHPLTNKHARIKRTDPRRWLCKDCAELVIERETDACYVCSKPFTPKAFSAMRKIQSNPHNRDARRIYEQNVQGRRIA